MNGDKGFTLVEIVVVVVILSVLALMLIPTMTGFLVKESDEQNWEDARNIFDSAQAEFFELYAVNSRDGNSESIVQGESNKNPNVKSFEYTIKDENNQDKTVSIKTVDFNGNKNFYPITTEIFRNIGYKVKLYCNSGKWVWMSDVPCWVMIITGDYKTYCDPKLETYCPEKAYTVYGVIFNKNVNEDFFILKRDGTKIYPRNEKEFDAAIDGIIDEDDPENPLVKEIYILKGNWADSSGGEEMWKLFHKKMPANDNKQKYVNKSYTVNGYDRYSEYH